MGTGPSLLPQRTFAETVYGGKAHVFHPRGHREVVFAQADVVGGEHYGFSFRFRREC
jgi:hypothetical protein